MRVLDLEIMPRAEEAGSCGAKLGQAQAIQACISKPSAQRRPFHPYRAKKIKQQDGRSIDLDRIQDRLPFLLGVSLSDQGMRLVRELIARLERDQASVPAAPLVHDVARNLQRLRNALAFVLLKVRVNDAHNP